VAAFVCGSRPAFALEGLAIVDYQLIFDKFEATADAQRTLDRELKEWENQGRDMREEIDRLNAELDSQRLMLSEDRLKEKQDELRAKREEYERFIEETFGVDGKAAQRNAELTKPIAEKILEAIAKIGKDNGLKLILDAGTGGVVWAEDDVNMTQLILEDLSISLGQPAAPGERAGETAPEEAGEGEPGRQDTEKPPDVEVDE
jgi:outer membrane protein